MPSCCYKFSASEWSMEYSTRLGSQDPLQLHIVGVLYEVAPRTCNCKAFTLNKAMLLAD